jgi:hypothetical protein
MLRPPPTKCMIDVHEPDSIRRQAMASAVRDTSTPRLGMSGSFNTAQDLIWRLSMIMHSFVDLLITVQWAVKAVICAGWAVKWGYTIC